MPPLRVLFGEDAAILEETDFQLLLAAVTGFPIMISPVNAPVCVTASENESSSDSVVLCDAAGYAAALPRNSSLLNDLVIFSELDEIAVRDERIRE